MFAVVGEVEKLGIDFGFVFFFHSMWFASCVLSLFSFPFGASGSEVVLEDSVLCQTGGYLFT